MTFLTQLWIPIVLSAVLVFAASSIIHMVFKYHNTEFRKLPDEDAVRAAIRASNPQPGQYMLPYCPGMEAMKTPEARQKFEEGPVGMLQLRPSGVPKMGGTLGMWFLLNLGVAILAGYLAAKTLPATASAGQVWRVTGLLTFMAYAIGSLQAGIWMARPGSAVAKEVFDSVIYAAITAAVFGWLWPR